MVPVTNKASSNKQVHFMDKNGPNVTNIGVNQQVNDRITRHVGDGAHFMANTIQTSSKGELANYYHQSLGSPTMWSILNIFENHPAELMPMPGMDKDLITKYLKPSIAKAKGHMVRVRNTYAQHTATDQQS